MPPPRAREPREEGVTQKLSNAAPPRAHGSQVNQELIYAIRPSCPTRAREPVMKPKRKICVLVLTHARTGAPDLQPCLNVSKVRKPRHDLRYPSVHFSRPYRPVK